MGTYDGEHARTKAKTKKLEEGPGWFREPFSEIDGRKCLNGTGPVPAKVLFVDKVPDEREVWTRKPYSGRTGQFLFECLKKAGWSKEQIKACRFTYATHHAPKKYTAAEVNWGKRMFREELDETDSEIVVCFGAEPLKQVVGPTYRWDDVHGAFIKPDSIEDCWFTVFPTFNLEQVMFGPKWDKFFLRDLEWIRRRMEGNEVRPPRCGHAVISDPGAIRSLKDWILTRPRSTKKALVTLDCEWNGRNWMDPDRYFRTVQVSYKKGAAVTVEIAAEGGAPVYGGDAGEVFAELKALLEHPDIGIIGHNVIADGEWLLSYGIDIRKNVVYDTMLAEYILNQNGPFGLEALAMKYTPYGRYSTDVEVWVRRHQNAKLPDTSAYGYGYVPREMLAPYAYADVDVLWYIMDRQIPEMRERGYFLKRGPAHEYPSLFQSTMNTQRIIYELERNGMLVDMDRLRLLSKRYMDKKSELLSKVMAMARAAGFEEFNPRSTLHLRKMLFGKLGLTPVKTTDGENWGDVVGELGMDSEEEVSAATDKTTLEILNGAHPFVDALLAFRRVDQICKQSLNVKDSDGSPAGLYAHIWPDGRFHTHLSQITETGRFTSSKPNCQNFGKKAEGLLEPIFGKDNKPPALRTIVVPPEGWVMIESDFVQAELFCMANLTQDQGMIKALTTPGLDLHDKTTVDSFGFHMYDENGHEVSEDDLIALAGKCGADSEDFQHFMKTLTYVDAHGKRLTRAEFKAGPRISGKSINFGIPYGRGAKAIALQIKAETGDKRPLDEISNEVAGVLEAWKTKAFPTCWNKLKEWSGLLYTQGYIENPFKRRKYGILRKGEKNASLERQFQNFNIQSTVGDVVQIAMDQMVQYRERTGLQFRLQNMIHDAVMIECPIDLIDECKRMFKETMAGIRIPLPDGKWFSLDVDIDVYERWGQKMK